jgi:hypothetical protein
MVQLADTHYGTFSLAYYGTISLYILWHNYQKWFSNIYHSNISLACFQVRNVILYPMNKTNGTHNTKHTLILLNAHKIKIYNYKVMVSTSLERVTTGNPLLLNPKLPNVELIPNCFLLYQVQRRAQFNILLCRVSY